MSAFLSCHRFLTVVRPKRNCSTCRVVNNVITRRHHSSSRKCTKRSLQVM